MALISSITDQSTSRRSELELRTSNSIRSPLWSRSSKPSPRLRTVELDLVGLDGLLDRGADLREARVDARLSDAGLRGGRGARTAKMPGKRIELKDP